MKPHLKRLCFLLVAGAPPVTGNTVNVDIQGATAGGPGFNLNIGTYTGTAAAPSTGTTWNAHQFNNTLNFSLLDDQGAATDVGIWLQANPGEWSYSNANTLMGDYTFSNTNWSNNAGQRFTIFSNLADGGTGMQIDGSKTYDIYIYTMGDAAGQHTTFQINHAGGTTSQTATGDGPFNGTFTEGANYLKFSNVTPKAYYVSGTDNGYEFEFFWGRAAGNTTAAAINGIQIVETEVPAVPAFVSQPADFTGFVGDVVTLKAQAVAAPAPTYQWQKSDDGINIWTDVDGAITETLSFGFLWYSDRGFYRVIATNSNDSSTSDVARIDLTYPAPEIFTQPQSVTVYEGGEVRLEVQAVTIETPEYQWYHGTPGDTSHPVSGATEAVLLIAAAQAGDAGDYWVRVTDPAATFDGLAAVFTDSATANVQVLPPRDGKVVLVDFNAGGALSGTATPADFTAAGVPGLTAADPVHVSTPLPADTATTEVVLSGGPSVYFADDDLIGGCNGGFAVNNGSALLNDYAYLQSGREGDGPTTVTLAGIDLDPGTTYTLYVFGSGDGAAQISLFTPVHSANITYQNTATSSGQLAVSFTTSASYANDPVVFIWARDASSVFAALNGIAIVPGGAPAADYASWIAAYPGTGSLTGFRDDADGDGLDNGVENFLGTDPSVANQGISGLTRNGNTLTFQHPQSAATASDVTGGYRWSTDLAAFHGDGASAGGTTVTFTPAVNTPVSGTTTVTAVISGNTPPRLFIALGVTKNP